MMQLSSLSLIYIALCAFVAASMLVVHMNYADAQSTDGVSPLAFGQYLPSTPDRSATASLWSAASSAIEM